MKIPPTLSLYLARTYFMNTLLLLVALLAILYLFDFVEISRRASKRGDVPLLALLQMALLKMPKEGQVLLPFAILYSAMFTLWQMTRRFEMIVVRAAGISFWQFLLPIATVAAALGTLQMTTINPLGASLITNYERMERKYLESNRDAQIALFREGLWLRQETPEGYMILNAPRISRKDWELQAPSAFFFTPDDVFLRRADAKSARLSPGQWIFSEPGIHDAAGGRREPSMTVPTTLTRLDIENSFSSPSTMSFWGLTSHIQTLEETGFDAAPLRIQFHNLLSQPFLYVAMILLAACVSLRPPRSRGGTILIAAGVGMGFMIFFFSSFLQALGASQQIPVMLAAWAPSIIGILAGTGIMMTLEDG